MTPKDLADAVSEDLGAPRDVTWGFVQAMLEAVIRSLNRGEEVRVRGLGAFRWVKVGPKTIPLPGGLAEKPEGWKLKFVPAMQFRTRRLAVEDEMVKYGVVVEKPKTASDNKPGTCPMCGAALDPGGACPEHGTEPFEDSDG